MANHSSNLLREPFGGDLMASVGGGVDLFSALQGFKWSRGVICQNNHRAGVKWVKLYYREVDGTHGRLVWEGDEIAVISESNRAEKCEHAPYLGQGPDRTGSSCGRSGC